MKRRLDGQLNGGDGIQGIEERYAKLQGTLSRWLKQSCNPNIFNATEAVL
jgi:hypothetical protein